MGTSASRTSNSKIYEIPELKHNEVFVERGDTVVQLAHRHDVPTSHVLKPSGEFPDPFRLYPGMILKIVPRAAKNPFTHRIVAGESLSAIARQYHICPQILMQANLGIDWQSLCPNTEINIPQHTYDSLCECCKINYNLK